MSVSPLKFRKKQAEVEAYQMTKERMEDRAFQDESDWPKWLKEAWNKPMGKLGSLSFDSVSYHLVLDIPEGYRKVNEGDWIVRDAEGKLSVCHPDRFKRIYEGPNP